MCQYDHSILFNIYIYIYIFNLTAREKKRASLLLFSPLQGQEDPQREDVIGWLATN